MRCATRITKSAVLLALGILATARPAIAEEIKGTITATKVIYEDSRLTGDVTCAVTGAPCISFGTGGLTLKLDGFTMTGQASLQMPCAVAGNGEAGIDVTMLPDETILGPGVVQGFRQFGIRLRGATGTVIRQVTASSNCWSGIFITSFGAPSPATISHDNLVEAFVSVRNGDPANPCGGIWLTGGSSHNRLRASRLSGNGYATQGNNFGVGLLGGSSDNVIEDNAILGNTNGVVLGAGVTGNIVRRNIVAGNPVVQTSVDHAANDGVDIKNLAAPGTNTVEDNYCLTATNAQCPLVPRLHPEKTLDGRGGESKK